MADIAVTIKRTKDLHPTTKRQIDLLTHEEFGNVDLVRRYQWAEPDLMATATKGREIVSFVGLLIRTVLIDGKPAKVLGVSNAVTPPEHRGKGYSRAVMQEVIDFAFKEVKAECALLLCRDHLVPYYEKLGWYVVKCPLQFNQLDGKKIWTANTMLYSLNGARLSPQMIDLQSNPW
jgi:predicted N-acetyltransferase YhbS